MIEIWNTIISYIDFNYIEMLILLFFTYSFSGWVMESVGGILIVKKFINRGFMIGPLCPVYGVGVVIITVLLGKYSNDLVALFILATVLCGVLEYLTSYIMEKLFNARWWDYTNRKFNINGRVCLENLCAFGIAGTVILKYINPFFMNLYTKVPEKYRHIITGILFITFIIDFVISFKIIFSFKDETYAKMDNTEEISNKVKDKAENIILQTESETIHKIRKFKIQSKRRIRYTRKRLLNSKNYSLEDLINKVNNDRKILTQKIAEEKNRFDEQIKIKKEEFEIKKKESKEIINNKIQKTKEEIQRNSKETVESAIKNIKMSSEEFSKRVRKRFGSQSILKRRLMNAFPQMKVNKPKDNKKKSKIE